jgi:hypothetical protein
MPVKSCEEKARFVMLLVIVLESGLYIHIAFGKYSEFITFLYIGKNV